MSSMEKLKAQHHQFNFFKASPSKNKINKEDYWYISVLAVVTCLVFGYIIKSSVEQQNKAIKEMKSVADISIEKTPVLYISQESPNNQASVLINKMNEVAKIKLSKTELNDEKLIEKKIFQNLHVKPEAIVITDKKVSLKFKTTMNTPWIVDISNNNEYEFRWNNLPIDVANELEKQIFKISNMPTSPENIIHVPLQIKAFSHIDSTDSNNLTKELTTTIFSF